MNRSFDVSPDVRASVNEKDGMLLDLRKGVYYSLNTVGRAVWARLAEGRSADDVVLDLGRTFGLPPDRIRPDVERFVERLLAKGILRVRA